jgi:energy-coupling factor transporter ATP-binding protein EcfA2
MIKLPQTRPPEFFLSQEAILLRQEAEAFFLRTSSSRAQARFDFQRIGTRIYPHVRRGFKDQLPAKCAYCETPIENPDIEAFRPKQRATNLDGQVDDGHYWWLMFEWSNYLPACRQCNTLKGQRFPVRGPRAQVGAVGPSLEAEKRLLLDPRIDDPARVLLFLDDGRVTSEDERGRVSIDVLGLNRESLVKARKNDLHVLLSLMAKSAPSDRQLVGLVGLLKKMTEPDQSFAAMRRQYVKAWAVEISGASPKLHRLTQRFLDFETALVSGLNSRKKEIKDASVGLTTRTVSSESYSIAAENVSDDYYRQARFIERFELRNIRAFENLALRASIGGGKPGEWLVLLGENGCGKSTVLQALACALVGQAGVESTGIKATDLLRRGCSRGQVTVHITGMSKPIVMTLIRRGNRIKVDPPEPKLMVLGYGATRLLKQDRDGAPSSSRFRINNLFDPYSRLSDGRPWLYEAKKTEFDRFVRSLSALLPRADGAKFTRRGDRIFVETPGVKDTLDTLSSGYQAVLALALDIMSVMRLGWQDMASAEGIVLIDEVDAHLHPRWKMRIVQRLGEVFPRMQFIVTSHEPLTLRGLEREEVAVLKRTLDGKVVAITADSADFPSPQLMRVDQLLTSELFGLNSTEDLAIDTLFEEYYVLLAQRSRTAAQDARLSELRMQLDDGTRLGLTPRERLVFEAADAMIAQSKANFETLSDATQAAARERLKSLWAEVRIEPPVAGSGS